MTVGFESAMWVIVARRHIVLHAAAQGRAPVTRPGSEGRQAHTGSVWSQRLDQAAVDYEVRARDIPRAITGQEEHQIGDFVGTGESSCYEASL